MPLPETPRVGYVVKRYPRYSETFIVNEILAHEAAGTELEIFSLRGTEDTHFQDILSRVRAPVTYLPDRIQKAIDLWQLMQLSAESCPEIWSELRAATGTDARELGHALALAAWVRERGITHLHAHFATSSATVARLAARFSGVPYSFTAHAKDIFHESVDPRDLDAKLRDASAVVTVSDFNLRYLNDRYPDSAADKVHRIYNGLDLERFGYRDPGMREPLIVAVGRLVEKKGFRYLIDACRLLRADGVRFRCVIVGSGDEEASLRARIAEQGLGGLVSLEGPRPQCEVVELVRSAAAFAAPGIRDGLPTVLLEAMALGTPCVATDVTGIPEVIRDGETGFCVAQEASGQLADALGVLLNNSNERVRLARNARALIDADFDVHRNAALVRRLFGETADRRQAGGGVA